MKWLKLVWMRPLKWFILKQRVEKGNTEYFRKSSVSLFNALTMALMDRAHETVQNGEADAWDTITIQMSQNSLNELGSEEVLSILKMKLKKIQNKGLVTKSLRLQFILIIWGMVNRKQFSKFRAMADNEFRASAFGGMKQGEIFTLAWLQGWISSYPDNVAKMTSKFHWYGWLVFHVVYPSNSVPSTSEA